MATVTSVGTIPTPLAATGSGTNPTNSSMTWGTGQNRTAGNLLVAVVTASGSTSAGATDQYTGTTGWTKLVEYGGTYVKAAVWTKTAAGGDAAPRFQSALSGTAARCHISLALYELQADDGSTPVIDTQNSSGAGTSGTLTITTAENVAATGEYAVAAESMQYTSSGANTWGTSNSFTNMNDSGTTYFHWVHAYRAGPPSGAALSYAPTHSLASTGIAGVIAVFKPGVPPTSAVTAAVGMKKMGVSGSLEADSIRRRLGFTISSASDIFDYPATSWGDASLATKLSSWTAKSYGIYSGWANVQLTGSALQIRSVYAAGAWTAAFLEQDKDGNFVPPYYIEARAMCSVAYGFLSAPVWSWSHQWGSVPGVEVDACEILGRNPSSVTQTSNGSGGGLTKSFAMATDASNWHTYAAAVYPDRVDFYVDDVLVNTITNTEVVNAGKGAVDRVTDADLCILLREGQAWEGIPDVASSPQYMTVDYIRAWSFDGSMISAGPVLKKMSAAGTLTGESSASGSITVKKMSAAGTLAGESSVSGGPSLKKAGVSGTVSGQSQLSASVDLKKIEVLGIEEEQCLITGDLTLKKMSAAGTLTGESSASGSITVKKMSAAGTAVGTSSVSGGPIGKKMKIAVTAAGTSSASGGPASKKVSVSGFTFKPPYVIVSGASTDGTADRVVTVAKDTSPGDTILVTCSTNYSSVYPVSVTDTKGNVYTLEKQVTNTPSHTIFRSKGPTGGPGGGSTAALKLSDSDKITVTLNGTSYSLSVIAIGLSPELIGPDDVIPASITTGNNYSPIASATPASDGDLAVAMLATSSASGTPTFNAPFTLITHQQTGSSGYSTAGYLRLGDGTTGVAVTVTESTVGSGAWRGIIYLLKAPEVSELTGNAGLKKMTAAGSGAGTSSLSATQILKKMGVSGSLAGESEASGDARLKKYGVSGTILAISDASGGAAVKKMTVSVTAVGTSSVSGGPSLKKAGVSGTVSGQSQLSASVDLKKIQVLGTEEEQCLITGDLTLKKMDVSGSGSHTDISFISAGPVLKKMGVAGTATGRSSVSGSIAGKKMTASGTAAGWSKVSGNQRLKKFQVSAAAEGITVASGGMESVKMAVSSHGAGISVLSGEVSVPKLQVAGLGAKKVSDLFIFSPL